MRFAKEMAFYSAYHQEKRNVWIHVLGVPMITFSLFLVLSRFHLFSVAGLDISASVIFIVSALAYYFSLDFLFALTASVIFGSLFVLAEFLTKSMPANLAWSLFGAGQIVGWSAQIYGHYVFEKSRPAFLDNLFQALVSAPLFVIADIYFELGFRKDLKLAIENELKTRGVWKDFSILKTS
jgi:uncharacterized membrane protein YGL010W